jgi:hypothetical protein
MYGVFSLRKKRRVVSAWTKEKGGERGATRQQLLSFVDSMSESVRLAPKKTKEKRRRWQQERKL